MRLAQRPGPWCSPTLAVYEEHLGEVVVTSSSDRRTQAVLLRGRAPLISAAEGSPRKSAPTLSISSSIITDARPPLHLPDDLPGNAPECRCAVPRISPRSRMPPSDMRHEACRSLARGLCCSPERVLAQPGAPPGIGSGSAARARGRGSSTRGSMCSVLPRLFCGPARGPAACAAARSLPRRRRCFLIVRWRPPAIRGMRSFEPWAARSGPSSRIFRGAHYVKVISSAGGSAQGSLSAIRQ